MARWDPCDGPPEPGPVEPRKSALIARDRAIPTAAEVVTWHESGLGFPARPRRAQTARVIVHWTGGERGAEGLHQTLSRRGLSVHFGVEHDGTVYQFMDADRTGAHAKSWNLDSIGIEVCCKGIAPASPRWPRREHAETIHGRRVRVLGWYPAQLAATAALCETLCRTFGLPLRVPREGDGMLAEAWPPRRMRAFRGVVGHYQTTARKLDPGVLVMQQLHDAFAPQVNA